MGVTNYSNSDFPLVGRRDELEFLDKLWKSKKAEFLILYGRKGIGKTRLLDEFRKRRKNSKIIYWLVPPDSPADHLRSFSQAIHLALHQTDAPADFSYPSWETACGQIAIQSREERIAVFIDEFTCLFQRNPSAAAKFQKIWDHILSKSNLVLCLTGSDVFRMQREFFSYWAPLYGRATGQIRLLPLPFTALKDLFPNYTVEERVAVHAMFGGIPAYLEWLDLHLRLHDNIRKYLLSPDAPFQGEASVLLRDFLPNPDKYNPLLTAFAHGPYTLEEISDRMGLSRGYTRRKLSRLIETGFVEQHTPVLRMTPINRHGRYELTDPYLRFYFRFLAERQINRQGRVMKNIFRRLPDFIETGGWRELCHEWIWGAAVAKELPFPNQIGPVWNEAVEIPICGIETLTRTLILGECRWTPRPARTNVLLELIEKTNKLVPPGDWKVYFLGFSRSGWTSKAHAYARKVNKHPVSGANWRSMGFRLVTLDQLDTDLWKWTGVNRSDHNDIDIEF